MYLSKSAILSQESMKTDHMHEEKAHHLFFHDNKLYNHNEIIIKD